MNNIVTNIDKLANTEVGKSKPESISLKYFAGKILNLMSVDAESFCRSKDWPYLWPGEHRDNNK